MTNGNTLVKERRTIEAKRPNWLDVVTWLPRRLTGGPFLLAFAICGAVVEGILLTRSPHPIYAQAESVIFPVVVVTALVWIWVTLGWAVRGAATLIHALLNRFPGILRLVVGFVLISMGAVIVLLYTFSWMLFLRTGQFANYESIQFGFENLNVGWLWHYMLDSEGSFLLSFVALTLFQVILTPVVIVFARKTAWRNGATMISPSTRRTAWWALTLLAWLLCLSIVIDRSALRVKGQTYELTNRLNPIVTLAVSGFQSLLDEPIEPCLEVDQLRLVESDTWQPPIGETNRPSILFLAVESLRHDVINLQHQEQEVTPNLNRLAANGLHLTRAYTQSTHSDYADVCIVSSLYPLRKRQHHFYRLTDPWPKTLIYDLLKPAGYATAIISSQNEAWGGMDKFLASPQLDFFYDAQLSGFATPVSALDVGMWSEVKAGGLVGKHDDAHTTDKTIEWITTQVQAGRPFFAGITFQNSHFPYPLPTEAERPFQPCNIDFPASFVDYPVEKVEVVRNAYLNSVRYCDLQIGRIVAALRKLRHLDDTILVVYGENGESFHENGQVTHANKPYEPSIRVACMVHAPQYLAARKEDYPVQLIDIVPTVLGMMDWPSHPNFQGTNILSNERPGLDQRRCFVHVQHALAHCDALLFAGRWKLHFFRDQGTFALFDLQNDPHESRDVAQEHSELVKQLQQDLLTWRRQQLAYYHFPFYYQKYYPPRFGPRTDREPNGNPGNAASSERLRAAPISFFD